MTTTTPTTTPTPAATTIVAGADRPAADRRTAARRAGDAAEASAARFLAVRGLVPLARQYVRRIGELDLVMVEPGTGTVVFVEVRFRTSGARGGAALTVDARKRRRLRAAAAAWLQRHADPRRPARIDVIGMAPGWPRDRAGGPGGPGSSVGAEARARPDASGEVGWEDYRLTWLPGAVDG